MSATRGLIRWVLHWWQSPVAPVINEPLTRRLYGLFYHTPNVRPWADLCVVFRLKSTIANDVPASIVVPLGGVQATTDSEGFLEVTLTVPSEGVWTYEIELPGCGRCQFEIGAGDGSDINLIDLIAACGAGGSGDLLLATPQIKTIDSDYTAAASDYGTILIFSPGGALTLVEAPTGTQIFIISEVGGTMISAGTSSWMMDGAFASAYAISLGSLGWEVYGQVI